jgi:Leucine-rich repeat (LRR) protein
VAIVFGTGVFAHLLYQAKAQREVVEWIEKNSGDVHYFFEFDSTGLRNWKESPDDIPEILLTTLGIDFFSRVKSVTIAMSRSFYDISPIADLKEIEHLDLGITSVRDIGPLKNLHKLQSLFLNQTKVADLTPLRELTRLKELELSYTEVKDISPLSKLEKLESLFLRDTKVDDVSPLSSLKKLKELDLQYTNVSDLSPLIGLKNLERINLYDTKVNKQEIDALQTALPNLVIDWDSD